MPKSTMPRPVHICQCGEHAWTALTRGYVTLVSLQDAHLLQERRWCARVIATNTYAGANSGKFYLHRIILALSSQTIRGDHRNGAGTDNRRSNLRPATHQENLRNARPYRNCSSKFRGVVWVKRKSRWESRITIDRKSRHLGLFNNEEEAARRYDAEATKRYGEFARLNFPQPPSALTPSEAAAAEPAASLPVIPS